MTTDAQWPDNVSVDTTADLLLIASRLLVAISARSIARVDETMTIPQLRAVLVVAAAGRMTVENLSNALGGERSATGCVAERLVAAGLVALRPHGKSRRELLVVLTPRGAKLVEDLAAFGRQEWGGVVRRMAPAEQGALLGALTAFTAAVGDSAASFDVV
jgi:DNA-binding MarR family transcriptional regulator